MGMDDEEKFKSLMKKFSICFFHKFQLAYFENATISDILISKNRLSVLFLKKNYWFFQFPYEIQCKIVCYLLLIYEYIHYYL